MIECECREDEGGGQWMWRRSSEGNTWEECSWCSARYYLGCRQEQSPRLHHQLSA